jgi:orotidine-5'-phosphate decarboxylase
VSFKQRMEKNSQKRKTDIVLALDFPFHKPETRTELLTKAQALLETVHPYVCAVKINHHLTLPLGIFDGVQTLINQAHDHGLEAIMDCKINDIGATNQVMAEYYFAAGFDAVIANPFVGWTEGLQPVFTAARKLHRGVILLAYMSHKAAAEGHGQTVINQKTGGKTPQYVLFAEKAVSWNADGVVVGATYPDKIREVYEIVKENVPIYSPGVGAQGGVAEDTRKAGARYLIVGREITQVQNPAEAAKKLVASAKAQM